MSLKQLAALALLSSFGVSNNSASPFKYDFVEAQILKPDSEVLDNGFGIEASYEFVPNYTISASYQQRKGDNNVFKRDSNRYRLGVGYHTELNRVTDLSSHLYYLHDKTSTDVKANHFTIDRKASGAGIQLGLRRVLGNDIDGAFNVGIRHLDGMDDGYAELGVEYHLSDALSLGATYTFDSRINSGSAKVRYAF